MALLKTFLRSRDGNVALLSAAAAVPVVLALAVSVDYSQIGNRANTLQQAVDSAALAIAREGKKLSLEGAHAIARQFINGNTGSDAMELSVIRNDYSVRVAATIEPELVFGDLLGTRTWRVGREAVAEYAPARYEIAFALDQTGSMEGAKLAAMKNAVNSLVEAMSAQVSVKSNLNFAVVPYAAFVNVGPQHAPQFDEKGRIVKGTGADWLDTRGKVKIDQLEFPEGLSRFQVYHALGVAWPGCVETRDPTKKGAHDVMDTEATSKATETLFVPTFAIDEPDDTWPGGWPRYPNNYIVSDVSVLDKTPKGIDLKLAKYGLRKVNGVIERDPALSVTMDNSPSIFYANEKDPKGPAYGCEVEPLLPLTSSVADVKAKVNAIKANGSTNITEGVMWGWRLLSNRAPFEEGSKTGARKILILLTDGANSYGVLNNDLRSGYGSVGYVADERLVRVSGTSDEVTEKMNEKTLAACTNAKADGVEIYTIRLEVDDTDTGTLLQACASGADHYFDSPSADDLKPVFEEIRDRLTVVRLAS
ncbi:MAG: hypothetical protein CMJ42_22615 [Phyllobacteriaceae bacterium]|nr:hypothetical protein [Phyllobacteriaceae bacterium]MBA91949.1 hypothetical protein [Phyllobacteriaceae bacterium]